MLLSKRWLGSFKGAGNGCAATGSEQAAGSSQGALQGRRVRTQEHSPSAAGPHTGTGQKAGCSGRPPRSPDTEHTCNTLPFRARALAPSSRHTLQSDSLLTVQRVRLLGRKPGNLGPLLNSLLEPLLRCLISAYRVSVELALILQLEAVFVFSVSSPRACRPPSASCGKRPITRAAQFSRSSREEPSFHLRLWRHWAPSSQLEQTDQSLTSKHPGITLKLCKSI